MGPNIAEFPNVNEQQYKKHIKSMEKENETWAKILEIKSHC